MKAIKLIALMGGFAFLVSCSSHGGRASGPAPVDDGSTPTPGPGPGPGPAPVTPATFTSNGGNATGTTDSFGGQGGDINIGYNNSVYGDVSVTTGGSVDTSFKVPTYNANYGTYKLTISADTVVRLSDPAARSVAGSVAESGAVDVYLKAGDNNVYYLDGTNEQTASGLEIQPGVTLTLPANSGGFAEINLSHAVTIDGTVRTTAEGVGLNLRSDYLLQIGTNGTVTTKPITPDTNGAEIGLYSGGVAINRGTIDASGSATTETDGLGGAGTIRIEADSFLVNTGFIYAKGGTSTLTNGGNGNQVNLYAYAASLFNSGTIDTSGGSGALAGGLSGAILFYGGSNAAGSLIVSGSLVTNGGAGDTGAGGYSNSIIFTSNGGKLWSNATISAKGGSSTASVGDSGGNFSLYGDYGDSYVYRDNSVETQGIKLSGTINLSGGNGATYAGTGGGLTLENNYSDFGQLPTPAVEMVGFASFNIDGGAGFTGGQGGSYQIYTNTYFVNGIYQPGGSIVNQVPVSAKGGAGSMINQGQGGAGGGIQFDYNGEYSFATTTTTTTSNSGAMDIAGGVGDVGGTGGWVSLYSYGKLTNSGAINARGGAGVTTGGSGSGNGAFVAISSNDIENTGTIDASGGSGLTGGNGSNVGIFGGCQTRNSAAITAAGGVGSTNGGNGGDIYLYSTMLPTSNSGILSVPKGAGGTTAIDGLIYIDFMPER